MSDQGHNNPPNKGKGKEIAPNQDQDDSSDEGPNNPANQGQNNSPDKGKGKEIAPNQDQNDSPIEGPNNPGNQCENNTPNQSRRRNRSVEFDLRVIKHPRALPGHHDPCPHNYRAKKNILMNPHRVQETVEWPPEPTSSDVEPPENQPWSSPGRGGARPARSASSSPEAGPSSSAPPNPNPQPHYRSELEGIPHPPDSPWHPANVGRSSASSSAQPNPQSRGSTSGQASSSTSGQASSASGQPSSSSSIEKTAGSAQKDENHDDDPPDPGLNTSASSGDKQKERERVPLGEHHGNELASPNTAQPSRIDKGKGPMVSNVSSDQRRASEGSAASPPASPAGNLVSANEIDQAISNASTAGGLPSAMAPSSDLRNIVRRKLTGYVGFANLPNQWHRKSVRKGFNFNVMVVGESGLGKSTLVNTLFNTSLYPPKERQGPSLDIIPKTVTIQSISADIEEAGVRLRLTVVDTPGFGDFVNNDESWRPIVDNIEQRYDAYLDAENKVNRMNIVDNRIHACVFFIQPTGHSLKPLDIEVMRRLHTKVNLIPVIAKADTLTDEEIANFKSRILADIKYHGIQIFEGPRYELDDEETIAENNEIMSKVPFAVVGATNEITNADGRKVRGRSYPWGVIEVDNEEHCDFVKLRQMLIRTHMEELKEHTNNSLYENYRTDKLIGMGVSQDPSVFKEVNPAVKQEEERALHEQKLAKMEAEMKMVFQQKVAEKESKLKQSEEELYSRHREMKEQLERQRMDLEEKKQRVESGRPIEKEGKRKGFSLR